MVYWKANDQDINHSINPNLRGVAHYCLSSQFFFILTIYLSGMILLLLGMAVTFNTSYNMFDDIAAAPISIFWIIITIFLQNISKMLAMKLNIWDYDEYQNK